jgi:hypothetical protein
VKDFSHWSKKGGLLNMSSLSGSEINDWLLIGGDLLNMQNVDSIKFFGTRRAHVNFSSGHYQVFDNENYDLLRKYVKGLNDNDKLWVISDDKNVLG